MRLAQRALRKNQDALLGGANAPLTTEVFQKDLPVTGQVPAELQGLYIRTGPNAQFAPAGGYHACATMLPAPRL